MNRLKFLVEPVKVLVEPGATPIFRLFTLIMQVILTLGICGQLGGESPDFFVIIYWIFNTILFAYLRIERFKSTFGVAYQPIGVGLATIGPILAEGFSPYLQLLSGIPPADIVFDPERLILWLIVPFLVVATQYDLYRTLLYTFATAIIPVVISIPAYDYGTYLNNQIQQGFVRLILFSLIGYVIVRLTQGEREQRQVLSEKNEALSNYAATLEELAISRERNRLARELHDTLSHTLSAVNIQLKALEALWESDPEAARERLTHMQALTRDGLNDARRSLQELRARPVEEFGLALALRRLIQQAAERGGFRYQVGIPVTVDGLPSGIEQQIYRITEESLNNIVRHAQAKRVELVLEQHNRHILLRIIDDGVGFDPLVENSGRFGLVGMRERAELIQGKFEIVSQPNGGTEVRIKIPV